MNTWIAAPSLAALLLVGACSQPDNTSTTPAANVSAPAAQSVYEFTVNDITGKPVKLADYQGKVLVIVNTASKCGLTPQYEEIEAFYRNYKDKNVVVLGFPANNFMGQEPGSNEEIATFCKSKYDVSFPMFSKISVKGDDQHPLYRYLTSATGDDVKWNFQKFVVGKDGKVVRAFNPRTSVNDADFRQAVDALI